MVGGAVNGRYEWKGRLEIVQREEDIRRIG